MNRALLFGLTLLVLLPPLAPAMGQEEGGLLGDLGLRIVPRFGLYSPDASLYEVWKNFAGDGFIEWTSASLGRAAFVGLGVEAEVPRTGLLVRGEVARTFEGWLTAAHGILIPRVYYEPPQVVNTWFDLSTALTFLNLQLLLPTRFEFHGVQPYVLAGYSAKWYSFGEPSQPNDVEATMPTGGFTPGFELGGGLFFEVFGLTFDAQIKDSANRYWGELQHDLIFSGGLVWAVR